MKISATPFIARFSPFSSYCCKDYKLLLFTLTYIFVSHILTDMLEIELEN